MKLLMEISGIAMLNPDEVSFYKNDIIPISCFFSDEKVIP